MKFLRKKSFLITIVIVTGIIIRIYWYLYNPSLWKDEAALANNVIRYNLIDLFTQPLESGQAAPPGYLAIVKIITMLAGNSELTLRFFSLLCGIVSVFLFFLLSRNILQHNRLLFANLLFCFCAPLVYHSSEAKQYATEITTSLLCLLLAVKYRYYVGKKETVVLAAAGSASIWFANPAIFVLSGIGIALFLYFLRMKQYKSLINLTLAGTCWIISFGIYYFVILVKNPNVEDFIQMWQSKFLPAPTNIYWYARTLLLSFDNPLGLSLDYRYLSTLGLNLKYALFFSYAALLLFVTGVYQLVKHERYLFLLMVSPVFVTAIASFMHQYPFHERFVVFLIPVFFIIMAKALEADAMRFPIFKIAVLPISIFVLLNLIIKLIFPPLFAPGEKFSNFREAVLEIQDSYVSDEPVYLAWNTMSLYQYYDAVYHLKWKVIKGGYPGRPINPIDYAEQISYSIEPYQKKDKKIWFFFQSKDYIFQKNEKYIDIVKKEDYHSIADFYYVALLKNNYVTVFYRGTQAQVFTVEPKRVR